MCVSGPEMSCHFEERWGGGDGFEYLKLPVGLEWDLGFVFYAFWEIGKDFRGIEGRVRCWLWIENAQKKLQPLTETPAYSDCQHLEGEKRKRKKERRRTVIFGVFRLNWREQDASSQSN